MNKRLIYITDYDYKRLKKLTLVANEFTYKAPAYIKDLNKELESASRVDPREVPPGTVTMNSKIRMRDLDSGEVFDYTLVFPEEANIEEGKISIMSPVGTSLIGYSAGDTVEWPVPGGVSRIKIEKILYQPESAGDYTL